MARRYRVGVVGFAHMHVNELVERLAATGRCDFVAWRIPCRRRLP
jgi:hypothetical protein